MSGNTLTRLLEWNDSWDKKLSEYIIAEDYPKVVGNHFKVGLGLLTTMKNTIKNHPEVKSQLKEKFEFLKSKLIVINEARKSIDTLK